MSEKRVRIFTDGGCRGNPGPGGWGAVLSLGKHEKQIKGAEHDTTNNRMELTAAIEALSALKRPCAVDLYTDSEYLRRGITEWIQKWRNNNWRTAGKKPVKNQDLWMLLDEYSAKHDVSWHWVKGHAGNPGNEMADQLVNQAIDELVL